MFVCMSSEQACLRAQWELRTQDIAVICIVNVGLHDTAYLGLLSTDMLSEETLYVITYPVIQALKLQQDGAIIVDPRVPWDFEKQRIEGAVSVPLFRGVAGKSGWDTAKRFVMAVGFAMRATGVLLLISVFTI